MPPFCKRSPDGTGHRLACEAEGLEALRQAAQQAGATQLRIAEVISVEPQALYLSYIESTRPTPAQWRTLGTQLARLHRLPQPFYGAQEDNYIGLNPQPNARYSDWGRFFLEKRLAFQVSLIQTPSLRTHFQTMLECKANALTHFLNRHVDQPSLLHGDLWSGNVLFDQHGPWLIDPAVYCGDREADLAMTELFGGFSPEFYQAYDTEWPRCPVYEQKRSIYNLYHNLNHYNLFGSAYLGACERGVEVLLNI